MATVHSIPTSKVNPKFLHSNSTSHVWAFSAVAELIDNAYDPDVLATSLIIDTEEINGTTCLVFQDNGAGMDNDHLYSMLSFGFCEKDQYLQQLNHLPIGQYGNGFKSGSMRLGKDALVFTRHKKTAGVGFLSQTFLAAIKAETVMVPLLKYSLPDLERDDEQQTRSCLLAILNHSLFNNEEQLKSELEKLKEETTGTKIIIYNLHTLRDGSFELDFNSDLTDIKCREVFMKDVSFTEEITVKKNASKYRNSLREYCRILYLRPKMRIKLRGKPIRAKFISKCLKGTKMATYRYKALENSIQITIGFRCEDHDSEDYGMMLYHRNRLIKAYEKVGYQKQRNKIGVGVIGAAAVDCLQPTHIKQDFIKDEKYNTLMKAFADKLNDYWNENKEHLESDSRDFQPDSLWINCYKCGKWRRMPKGTNLDYIPDEWNCTMNPDCKHNRCDCPEEPENIPKSTRNSRGKKAQEMKSTEKISQDNDEDEGAEDAMLTSESVSHAKKSNLGKRLPSKPECVTPIKKNLRKRSANVSYQEDEEQSDYHSQPSPTKRVRRHSNKTLNVTEENRICEQKEADNGDVQKHLLEKNSQGSNILNIMDTAQDLITQSLDDIITEAGNNENLNHSHPMTDNNDDADVMDGVIDADIMDGVIDENSNLADKSTDADTILDLGNNENLNHPLTDNSNDNGNDEIYKDNSKLTMTEENAESTNAIQPNSQTPVLATLSKANARDGMAAQENLPATSELSCQSDRPDLTQTKERITKIKKDPNQTSEDIALTEKNLNQTEKDITETSFSSNDPTKSEKEKLNELSAELSLKSRILQETEERLRKFKYDVHHLLRVMAPAEVNDVKDIEQTVKDMIKRKDNNSGVKPCI